MRVQKPASDPYRILGVVRGADVDQIKAAHRRLAKRYHPDGSTGDEQRFLAVQEAYQLLTDPSRRGDWDRRHQPGPVRADGAGRARRKRTRPDFGADPSTRADDSSRQDERRSRQAKRPSRDPRRRTRTWSAERVPWWEDFVPRDRRGADGVDGADGADGADGSDGASEAEGSSEDIDESGRFRQPRQMDFDVFNRSSGAAWSMAARQHFRSRDADLPSRGAWRYRGTQVVTGAEARKVAAEEAAAEEAAADTAARDAEDRQRAYEEPPNRRASRPGPNPTGPFEDDPSSST